MEGSRQVPPPCTVSVVGGQRVTINNGSPQSRTIGRVVVTPLSANPSARRMVATSLSRQPGGCQSPLLVTQTSSAYFPSCQRGQSSQGQQAQDVSMPPLQRVLVRAVPKGASKDVGKTFTMRNLDTVTISSTNDLKVAIREQLNEDIVAEDFDVGFVEGSSVVRMRSKQDLYELWSRLRKPGTKMSLWCDGLLERGGKKSEGRKRARGDDVGSENESGPSKKKPQSDRAEKVQEIADRLKERHGSRYTPMQIRIWAEMIASGLHCSEDDPPSTTMFLRAGGSTPHKKKDQTPVAQALTDVATAFASALSPRVATSSMIPSMGSTSSPAKVIESRSKLYKQLTDLQNLLNMGILTDDEYKEEKDSIMNLLHQLKAN